jgi:hypothetical protein
MYNTNDLNQEIDLSDPCFHCNGDCSECESRINQNREDNLRMMLEEDDEDVFVTLGNIFRPDDRLQTAINNIEFNAMKIEKLSKTL